MFECSCSHTTLLSSFQRNEKERISLQKKNNFLIFFFWLENIILTNEIITKGFILLNAFAKKIKYKRAKLSCSILFHTGQNNVVWTLCFNVLTSFQRPYDVVLASCAWLVATKYWHEFFTRVCKGIMLHTLSAINFCG